MIHAIPFFPQVSSMGITPFFVENVSELQLCAIKLVTAVSLCFSLSLYLVYYFRRFLLTFVYIHWCFILVCVFAERLTTWLLPISRCSHVMRSIGSWSWRRSLRLWPDCPPANAPSGISGNLFYKHSNWITRIRHQMRSLIIVRPSV